MRRREFIRLLGGTAATWPLAARAQPAMPRIGFLHPASPDGNADRVRAFRQGLKETGFIDGESVAIEYRWADNQAGRLPALATELVRQPVAVIVVFGPVAAFAAKAATTTIPIVFVAPEDPVRLGLVTSLARPGGNLTGINFFPAEVSGKRLELLRELVPRAVRIAVLVESSNPTSTELTLRDVEAASREKGMQIQALKVGTSRDIDAAFESFARERPDGLMTAVSAFLVDRRVQVALQAAIHRVAAISAGVDAGLAQRIAQAGSIAHQPSGRSKLPQWVDRWQGIAPRECDELFRSPLKSTFARTSKAPIRCCTRRVKAGSISPSTTAVPTINLRPSASAAACTCLLTLSAFGLVGFSSIQ